MSTGNTIQASFGVDISPLKRDLDQAASAAKTGGAKVEAAMAASAAKASRAIAKSAVVDWNKVYQQTGFGADPVAERRRRNSAAGFRPAPAGKYAMPQEEESGGGKSESLRSQYSAARMVRGLLAIGGINQLVEMVVTASENADKLRQHVQDITKLTGSGAFRGVSEMQSNLSEAAAAADDIHKDKIFDHSSVLRSVVAKARDFVTGQSEGDRAQMQRNLRTQAKTDVLGMAGHQEGINAAQEEALHGSKEQAELLKAEADHRERLRQAADAEVAAGIAGVGRLVKAENARYESEKTHIKEVAALHRKEQTMESAVGGLSMSSMSPAQQNIAALQLKGKFLAEKFKTGNEDQKVDTGIEMGRNSVEQIKARYDEFNKPYAQRVSENMEQRKLRNFAANLEPSNPNAYLTSPDAYNQTDSATGANAGGGGYKTPTFSSNLGALGAQMSPFGGSDSFNAAFHPSGAVAAMVKAQPTIGSKEMVANMKAEQAKNADREKPLNKGEMNDLLEKYWGGN